MASSAESWIQRARGDGIARFGDSSLGERYNRALFKAKARALSSALLGERLPEPRLRRCLDAGVGHGWLLKHWRRQGVGSISGLDAVAQVAREAERAVPGARVRVADLASWKPEPEGAQDLVCALDVLFYLKDDGDFERGLRALGSAVRPGGILVVSDTFPERPVDSVSNRSRPLAEYARVLSSEGFTLRRRRGFFVLANSPCPRSAGGSLWQNLLHPAVRWILWNLAHARSPLARPLEAAAVEAIYALDALILSQGGRWGSQEIAVWRKKG